MAVELASASGGAIKPRRNGSRHLTLALAGIYKSREGHVVIVPVGEEMWRRLAGAIDRSDLLQDDRFADNAARVRHIAALERIIEDWLKAQPSDAAALDALQPHRVSCAPVLAVEDAMRHPHLVERYTVRDVEDPTLGRFLLPGLLHVVGEPPVIAPAVPTLGKHNEHVLSQHLGLARAEIDALENDGVLSRASPR